MSLGQWPGFGKDSSGDMSSIEHASDATKRSCKGSKDQQVGQEDASRGYPTKDISLVDSCVMSHLLKVELLCGSNDVINIGPVIRGRGSRSGR